MTPTQPRGQRVTEGIGRQLEPRCPSAAASLREGPGDMFAVRRLGCQRPLGPHPVVHQRHRVDGVGGVHHHRPGEGWKAPRWRRAGSGPGCSKAERSFWRVKGCADMPALVTAVQAEVTRWLAEDQAPVAYGTGVNRAVAYRLPDGILCGLRPSAGPGAGAGAGAPMPVARRRGADATSPRPAPRRCRPLDHAGPPPSTRGPTVASGSSANSAVSRAAPSCVAWGPAGTARFDEPIALSKVLAA